MSFPSNIFYYTGRCIPSSCLIFIAFSKFLLFLSQKCRGSHPNHTLEVIVEMPLAGKPNCIGDFHKAQLFFQQELLGRSIRHRIWYWCGARPIALLNNRVKWYELSCTKLASSAKLTSRARYSWMYSTTCFNCFSESPPEGCGRDGLDVEYRDKRWTAKAFAIVSA